MNNTKAALVSTLATGILFSALTFLFTSMGILIVNHTVLAGLSAFILPLTGLLAYLFLNLRFPGNGLDKFSLSVSNLVLGICIAFLFFGYLKWYTATIFFISFALLAYVEYVNKLRFMYRFYRIYVLLLVPFYAVCLYIKNSTALKFDENATLKLKLGGVSVEAYFYLMVILLAAVYLFELFKRKITEANG